MRWRARDITFRLRHDDETSFGIAESSMQRLEPPYHNALEYLPTPVYPASVLRLGLARPANALGLKGRNPLPEA